MKRHVASGGTVELSRTAAGLRSELPLSHLLMPFVLLALGVVPKDFSRKVGSSVVRWSAALGVVLLVVCFSVVRWGWAGIESSSVVAIASFIVGVISLLLALALAFATHRSSSHSAGKSENVV
jgi:hypothetical protein